MAPCGGRCVYSGKEPDNITRAHTRLSTASRLGLGTHSLHRLLSPAARSRVLQTAYELGVRYFDTAPSYGAGLAERELGRLARGRRSTLTLATKFGIEPSRLATLLPAGALLTAAGGAALRAIGLRRSPRAPKRDYGVPTLRRSAEDSLRRLRTDYLDILYLHAPTVDSLGDADGLADAMQALVKLGKVRHIGLAGEPPDCLALAERHPALAEVLQMNVPADARGLPASRALPAEAALAVWEFPAPPDGAKQPPLSEVLECLDRALPGGPMVLSTRHESLVREAARLLSQGIPRRPP